MSFSAHADAKGIMQLISHCEPKNILLVHGEAAKMEFLRKKIEQEFGSVIFHLLSVDIARVCQITWSVVAQHYVKIYMQCQRRRPNFDYPPINSESPKFLT